ncbi:MAG TPA: hypothetical protein VJ903_03380 [Clostridia bacterium]|nr:hypothetical protein [Clostridia bacterium]
MDKRPIEEKFIKLIKKSVDKILELYYYREASQNAKMYLNNRTERFKVN